MRHYADAAAALAAVFLLGACDANYHSVFRQAETDGPETILIDAKQRAIITRASTANGMVACAEPSPDALSAISSNLSASAELQAKFAAALSAQSSEGAAGLGLRTQTITILRDAMYRLCEGYMAGALTPVAFQRMERRYQNAMIGLLAIEQLTGAVVARQPAINTTSSGSTGRALEDAIKLLDTARTREKAAKTALDEARAKTAAEEAKLPPLTDAAKTARAAADAAPADTEKKTAAEEAEKKAKDQQQAIATAKRSAELAEATHKEEQEIVAAAQANVRQAKLAAEGGASASVVVAAGPTLPLNAATIEQIGDTVENVVKEIVRNDLSHEECMNYLIAEAERETAASKLQTTAASLPDESFSRIQSLFAPPQKQQTTEQENAAKALFGLCEKIFNKIAATPQSVPAAK